MIPAEKLYEERFPSPVVHVEAGSDDDFETASSLPPPVHAFGDRSNSFHLELSSSPHKHAHVHAHGHSPCRDKKASHFHGDGVTRRSFWNVRCSCVFSSIPDELLVGRVMTFLDVKDLCQTQLVCTRWRFVSTDPSLWHNIDLSKFAPKMDDSAVRTVVQKYGTEALSLKLCHAVSLSSSLLDSFTMLGTAAGLRRLRQLHLCSITHVKDQALIQIAEQCTNLEDVSLAGCSSITDASVQVLTDSCPNLFRLSLRDCWQLTDQALMSLPSPCKLSSLSLDGCARMSENVCTILALRAEQLNTLNLRGIAVTDNAVHDLSRGCPLLKALDLSSNNPFGGSQISDDGVEALSKLVMMERLNLQGAVITDAGVCFIAENFPNLKALNLGSCYRITDEGVGNIVRNTENLTHLSLFQCFNLTDVSIHNISRNLASLKHLDLHSCVGLEKVLTILEDSPYVDQLKFLDLGSCRNVSAEDVESFRTNVSHCKLKYY